MWNVIIRLSNQSVSERKPEDSCLGQTCFSSGPCPITGGNLLCSGSHVQSPNCALAQLAPGFPEGREMLSRHQNCLSPGQGHSPAFFRGESTFFLVNLEDIALVRSARSLCW